jgi:hypothetical protein
MKIGIIVYSKTGNTLLVAQRLQSELAQDGHTVDLERFSAETAGPNSNLPVRLTATPDPGKYETVIFGAPVQAFSLDPAMVMYLKQMQKIPGVAAYCFVTQHFKKPWLGGNRATEQLMSLLGQKGVPTAKSLGIVNWSCADRDAQITEIAQNCRRIVESAFRK